jgi:glutathione S-transferase
MSDSKSVPVLTYFNGRGLGEISRLLFAAANAEFKDVRIVYGSEEWPAKKASTPYGQLPILEVNGKTFGQSAAIQRYIAKTHGLYGANDLEALAIDGVYEALLDTRKGFFDARNLKDETEKKAAIAKYFTTSFVEWAGKLTAALSANGEGKGWFVGTHVSLADIAAYHTLAFALETEPTALNAFPLLDAHVKRVAAVPGVAAWLAKRPQTTW